MTPEDARNERNLVLAAKLDRYQAVIDAARAWVENGRWDHPWGRDLIDAVRALDGEAGQ